jgi:hypothetical protein
MFMTSISNSKLEYPLISGSIENSIKCDEDFNSTESIEDKIYEPSIQSYRDTHQNSGDTTNRFKRVTINNQDRQGKDALISYLMK